MKKQMSLLLVFLLVLGLSACGKGGEPKDGTTQSSQDAAATSGMTDEQGTSAAPAGADNPNSVTWLYNADFSAAPLENYEGTILPIHAQLPLDLNAMDEQLKSYKCYFGEDRILSSMEELLKDETSFGTDREIFIREGQDYLSGMPDKIELPLLGREKSTVSENLKNNEWYFSPNISNSSHSEKLVAEFLDCNLEDPAAIEDYGRTANRVLDAVLAKFGTPHRIYGLSSTVDKLKDMRAGTLQTDKDQYYVAYVLAWIFPEYSITVSVQDMFLANKSGDTPYRGVLGLIDVSYYPRACWDQKPAYWMDHENLDYLEPYALWGK